MTVRMRYLTHDSGCLDPNKERGAAIKHNKKKNYFFCSHLISLWKSHKLTKKKKIKIKHPFVKYIVEVITHRIQLSCFDIFAIHSAFYFIFFFSKFSTLLQIKRFSSEDVYFVRNTFT